MELAGLTLVNKMLSLSLLFSFYFVFIFFSSSFAASPANFNATAISACHEFSVLECWQLSAPFVTSTQAGTIGAAFTQLGNTATASLSILPRKFNGGMPNAPAVHYVQLHRPHH